MSPISRRAFLTRTGRAALGMAAASNAWVLHGCGGGSGTNWGSLAAQLDGQLLRPSDPLYPATGLSENTISAAIRPAAIALCANARDVQTCVVWAQDNGVPLVAQSGGHSYGGYSTTEGLLISVRPMHAVRFDPRSEIATIGSGMQLGSLYDTLFSQGFFVPAGRCTSVGIAGFVLGGGFGFETRRFGVTCDLMTETEIVTADGRLLVCNEAQNSDLFWACRGGGGGNFGINTSFTMRALPIVATTYGKVVWSFDDVEAVWTELQTIAITAPDAMGMRNGIARSRIAVGAPSTDTVSALFIYSVRRTRRVTYWPLRSTPRPRPRSRSPRVRLPTPPASWRRNRRPTASWRNPPTPRCRFRQRVSAQSWTCSNAGPPRLGGHLRSPHGRRRVQHGQPDGDGLRSPRRTGLLRVRSGLVRRRHTAADRRKHRLGGSARRSRSALFQRRGIPKLHRSDPYRLGAGLLRRELRPLGRGQANLRSRQRLPLSQSIPVEA